MNENNDLLSIDFHFTPNPEPSPGGPEMGALGGRGHDVGVPSQWATPLWLCGVVCGLWGGSWVDSAGHSYAEMQNSATLSHPDPWLRPMFRQRWGIAAAPMNVFGRHGG